jgi:hypothetical protein
MSRTVLAVLLVIGLVGCRRAPFGRDASASAVPAPASASPSASPELDLPVLEDFEARAQAEITATNFDQQLQLIEQEIGPIH